MANVSRRTSPVRAPTGTQPLADRVVVRANERAQTTSGGIVLPETAAEKPQAGTVVAVGRGRLSDRGTRVAPQVKAGDTVLYPRYAGIDVEVDGVDVLILDETDVLAVRA